MEQEKSEIARIDNKNIVEYREATPNQMMMLAIQNNADFDKLSKLMDLMERNDQMEAKKAFNKAMSDFRAEELKVNKTGTVDYSSDKGRTFFKHALLSEMVKVASPIMSKHGLSHNWQTTQDEHGRIGVTCTLRHQLGHSESITLYASADGTGGKNNIQAIGSTIKYLQRYTFQSITGIAEQDEDELESTLMANVPDQPRQASFSDNTVVGLDKVQASELEDLANNTGTDIPKFFEYISEKEGRKIASFKDIPARAFNPLKKMLSAKLGQSENPFNQEQ